MNAIEGNITEIDQDNKYFILTDKEGKSTKVFWKPQHESYISRQKVGYYEKPVVELAEDGTAQLEDIFYVQRPADYPRIPKQKGQYQYRGKTDQERKEIMLMACLKSATELYVSPFGSEDDLEKIETYEEICTRVAQAAKKMAEELMKV